MTPTSASTAAGSEPALHAWLRRAARHPAAADRLLLRGSLLLRAWCPGRARPAADVDYLVLGAFDADATAQLAHAIAALPDDSPPFVIERTELTWAETAFPGVRAHVRVGGAEQHADGFHVDFAYGDPLSLPPRPVRIDGVGEVLACAAETLFAWKLHGLVEFGAGRWRAKDLYDLDLMWHSLALDRAALGPAVDLAFASRSLPLAALGDFRTRATWGTSRGGVRKWRALAQRVPQLDDFVATRARVRAAVDAILAPMA